MAYIRTFTRDAQIAEDLFQETMLIAWRKFDEFDSRQSLSAWLRGIAKNLIRNAWRKQSNDKLVFDESTEHFARNTIHAVEMQGSDTWLERLSAIRLHFVVAGAVTRVAPGSLRRKANG